ncbi:hypothetical protein C4571_01705 [Candidatus Parcubacteria bacterium]|nr:MAG: hypothetical protein C4571_01705 [Candidatus Parcubacteria bacterium]
MINSLTNSFRPGDVLIALGVAILIFLALREFLCWYWKINKIVGLLEDIKENTKKPPLTSTEPTLRKPKESP